MSKNLKLRESRKLFFSKYLYKLVFRNELGTIFKSHLQKKEKLSYARIELDAFTELKRNNLPMFKKQWRAIVIINEVDYLDAMDIYTALKGSDEYKIRIDPNHIVTLFSNNKKFLWDIANRLRTSNVEFWQPNEDCITLLTSNTKIQIVDEPPKLPLKIWFNSKRINLDFANWLRANNNKCKIGKVALENLEKYGYLDGLYIYLRDEKVLSLVTLLAGASIRSIEKLVYRGDIDKY